MMSDNLVKQYKVIIDMMAKTLGSDCEVVLHDLTLPEKPIVYGVNTHVTKKREGRSYEELFADILESAELEEDCLVNRYYHTNTGKLVRSSTALLRDEENQLIGAISMTLDTTKISQCVYWLNTMMPNMEYQIKPNVVKTQNSLPADHITVMIEKVIEEIIGNQNIELLRREDKIELIREMERQGVFLVKGAIDMVAEQLSISKVTVYSYIDEVKGKKS